MSRKQERERRETVAMVELVDGVLENWGIEMHRGEDIPGYVDDREPSERFAAQIGEDEAVEYDEVYALICDLALEVHNHKRAGLDAAEAEVKRLRGIIEAAYSNQGWDIGSVKNLLIAGLEGYENSGWAKLHEPEVDDSYERAEAARLESTPQILSFGGGDIRLEFGEGSSEEGWWIELVLDDEHSEDRVRLSLSDMDAIKLSDRLAEKVREGRKDWS